MADVREHLTSSRVVTLVGHGGVGKTRVALKTAELARHTYPDGFWIVPLADLTEPDLLNATVAEAMSLHATDRPWELETLADHVADRTALLVLDNCEHLLAAVSDLVVGLRATCPNVRFLLTSRRPLRISGEDVVAVPPLSLPDGNVATPESITHYEAVTLFLDRAVSARSDFQLTPDNAAAVVTLCRELDGIPLAIELAAARIRARTPQEICESLTQRLDVLNLGYLDVDDRHRSLRACLEWSYDLCEPLEQRLWTRSSVFVGGFDLESAAGVCVADDLPAEEILALTSALVDQSVVVAEEADPGRTRYRMLADVRQFGLEQAEKDGELQGLHQRHASWYAELGSRFDKEASGPHQADWLRLLRREHTNLRAAVEYFFGTSGAAAAGLVLAQRARPLLVGLRTARRGTPLAGRRAGHAGRDAAGASRCDGRRRPLRGPPERPGPGQGAGRRGDRPGCCSTMTPGRSGCCSSLPPCSRSGTALLPRRRSRPTERWPCSRRRPFCPAS